MLKMDSLEKSIAENRDHLILIVKAIIISDDHMLTHVRNEFKYPCVTLYLLLEEDIIEHFCVNIRYLLTSVGELCM